MQNKCAFLFGLVLVAIMACNRGVEISPTVNKLYNGIILPEEWPPRYPLPEEKTSMPLPYLSSPQKVIPVNLGRQLFVDDFLIDTSTLSRSYYYPEYYKGNPVLEPDKTWERTGEGTPYASPFSDGIWFDETDNKFKMWYLTGGALVYPEKQAFITSYAESVDGISWEKPELEMIAGTNIIDTLWRDSNTIWLDKSEVDPQKRFKMFQVVSNYRDSRWRFILRYSADGVQWNHAVAQSGDVYDRSTVFYNPFRNKWIWSLRNNTRLGRARQYLEHFDPEIGTSLIHRVNGLNEDKFIVNWFTADGEEPRHPKFPEISPEIYNHDALAYESILLGYFSVWQGPENNICDVLKVQKRNEVCIGYSRDGFHWYRPDHKPFLGVDESEGAWNWGNVQSIVGSPIIVGDSLFFFVSGRRLNPKMWDGYTSTGLAILRRDGFVSMKAEEEEAFLITRNLLFEGNYLFINADVHGKLYAELIDEQGEVIPGYSKEDCLPFQGNSTKYRISWNKENDLNSFMNKEVKLKFYITDGEIFSFWISPWETGESKGYTAGGGPGLHSSGIDLPVE